MFFSHLLKLLSKISKYSSRLSWKVRCHLWNQDPEFDIAESIFFHRTADIQRQEGERYLGGKVSIKTNAFIMNGVTIAPYGGSIQIAENVFVGPCCVLYGHGGLVIGKNTMIAAHSVVIPSNHVFSDRDQPINQQPATSLGIKIGEDVWIGCGVKILDGVSIGKGCVIGAGAIVNKSIPEYSIAVGVPAKVIGIRGRLSSSLSAGSS